MKAIARFLELLPLAAAASLLLIRAASADALDDRWHYLVGIPFWMPGISGDVQTATFNDIPVDASFSQLMSHFTFGAMLHAEARKERYGLGADLFYINLSDALDRERALPALQTLSLGLKQVLAELFGFYRVIEEGSSQNPSSFDLLGGARFYWTQSEFDRFTDSLGWVDMMLGLRGQLAFGEHLNIRGRSDYAFLGSKFTWNLIGEAAWVFSEHWTASAGYRAMNIDYENSSKNRTWDLNYHGPVVSAFYSW